MSVVGWALPSHIHLSSLKKSLATKADSMRRHTQHPYYSRYGGGQEVPGPALPQVAQDSPVCAGGEGYASRGSGDEQIRDLDAQHALPHTPAEFGAISASQPRLLKTGSASREAGAGQANTQQPLMELQSSSNTARSQQKHN